MSGTEQTESLHNKGTDRLLIAIKRAKPRNIVAEIMNEKICFGGIHATRYQAFKHGEAVALARGADATTARRCGDRCAFQYPEAPNGEGCVMTWEEARERGLV